VAFDALGRGTVLTNASAHCTTTNVRDWIRGSKDFGEAISGVARTKN